MNTLIHFVREQNIRDKFFCTADPSIIGQVLANEKTSIAEGTRLRIHNKDYVVKSQIHTTETGGCINEWESHYYGEPAEYSGEIYFHVELEAVHKM